MVNPSVIKRREFYSVNSSPSYFFDGDADGGGGGADNAKSIFESKVDPTIAKHLAEQPGARIKLRASSTGSMVKVRADVSKVASTSDKLRLQIALAEDVVTYSGENGERFHPMVVRSMALDAKSDQGFALKPGKGGTFEYTFDIAKAVADAKAPSREFREGRAKGRVHIPPEEARDHGRPRGRGVRAGRGDQEGPAGDLSEAAGGDGRAVAGVQPRSAGAIPEPRRAA